MFKTHNDSFNINNRKNQIQANAVKLFRVHKFIYSKMSQNKLATDYFVENVNRRMCFYDFATGWSISITETEQAVYQSGEIKQKSR